MQVGIFGGLRNVEAQLVQCQPCGIGIIGKSDLPCICRVRLRHDIERRCYAAHAQTVPCRWLRNVGHAFKHRLALIVASGLCQHRLDLDTTATDLDAFAGYVGDVAVGRRQDVIEQCLGGR